MAPEEGRNVRNKRIATTLAVIFMIKMVDYMFPKLLKPQVHIRPELSTKFNLRYEY